MILTRKQEVDKLEEEGEEGMIHSLLSSLPDLHDDWGDEGETIPSEEAEAEEEAASSIMSTDVDTVRSMENVVLDTTDVQDLASAEEPGSAEDGLVPFEGAQRGREDSTGDKSAASSHEQDANVAHTDANQTSHVPEPTSQTENTSLLDESNDQEKASLPLVRSRSP